MRRKSYRIPCVVSDIESDVLGGMASRLREVKELRSVESRMQSQEAWSDAMSRDLSALFQRTIVINGSLPAMTWGVLPIGYAQMQNVTLTIFNGIPAIDRLRHKNPIVVAPDVAEILIAKSKGLVA